MTDYRQTYEAWLTDDAISPQERAELRNLTDETEIEDRFYKELEFGTAGLRGVLGAGTNRMNDHTVGKATLGLARYLTEQFRSAKVVIAYDSRIKSLEFAQLSAQILAECGHQVFLFDSLRPVPLLSYAVRYLKADSGIVITASHNPKQYNGFKVYSAYGGQVTDEEAADILTKINQVASYSEIKAMNYEAAIAEGKIKLIGAEVDRSYYESIKTLTIKDDLVRDHAGELKVIYTPLHGTGNIPVRTVLSELGYGQVQVVPEQELPDGTFPTAPYPNPENPDVFKLALAMNQTIGADLIFGTDPDCDRLGLIVFEKDGTPQVLSGNQTGMLITHYMLKALAQADQLPKNGVVIKTIVTTESVRNIARKYGVEVMDVLTGFKYIGEKIEEFKETGSHHFIFGFEESFGYSLGTFTRDKDAVVTAMMVCEMALYYKTMGMTLYDALMEVYDEFGYFREGLISYTRVGKEGAQEIKQSMEFFQGLDLKDINQVPVVKKQNFLSGEETDAQGNVTKLSLPSANVVKFMLADDSWFVIRPSGTEPKMKAYTAVCGTSLVDSTKQLAKFTEFIEDLVDQSFAL
ncbi:MAG: phospho-sugar mutase [Clostridiaceae bacterium]